METLIPVPAPNLIPRRASRDRFNAVRREFVLAARAVGLHGCGHGGIQRAVELLASTPLSRSTSMPGLR